MIKKIMLLMSMFMFGCSSNTKLERVDKLKTIEYSKEIGYARLVTISEVKFSIGDKDKIESYFRKSTNSILGSELYKNGFTVLERNNMDKVMNEHMFSTTMGSRRLGSNFYVGEYSVFLDITNIGIGDSGFVLPLIYNNIDHKFEVSVDLKFVDNVTGESFISVGSSKVTENTWNLLIFIGDMNKDYSSVLETALKLAIRDAILNTRFEIRR